MISPEERSEAAQQAAMREAQLAQAFHNVFGQPGKRSTDQNLVYDHLAVGEEKNAYQFAEGKDGIAMIAAGIHKDGAMSQIRIINRQLKRAIRKEPKPKPTTKR